MMKRVVLFLLTNLAVMLVLGVVVNLLGLNTFVSRSGLNLPVLFGFALVFGIRGGGLTKLFMTHPPLEDRIAALRAQD